MPPGDVNSSGCERAKPTSISARNSRCGCARKACRALRRNQLHLHGAKSSVFRRVGGIVAEGVLVANVAGDLLADRPHLVEGFGEISHAAGDFGKFRQFFLRLAHHFLVVLAVVVAEYADGVNRGVRIARRLSSFPKGFAAGVVVAVGDHEQHALVLVALLQVVERTDHGVVERRAAARVDARERLVQVLLDRW